MLTEQEVVGAVLDVHSERDAEKFIQEVYWRTYWKGWLEMRPRVWRDYLDDLAAAQETVDSSGLVSSLRAAEEGATGIECFDAWTRELVASGYLHNHARMWFASIWIFTLELPWVLGAAFFYRHLLDADPASNTLSWRWVAGLHTRGKFYVARAENIRRFTQGRLDPGDELNENPGPIVDSRSYEAQPLAPPVPSALSDAGGRLRTGFLLTEDDLHGTVPQSIEPTSIARLAPTPGMRCERSLEFSRRAMDDAQRRLALGLDGAADAPDMAGELIEPEDVAAWVEDDDLDQIVCFEPGVGETAATLDALASELEQPDTPLTRIRSPWDERLFPHARAGYFRFKKRIPEDLERIRRLPRAPTQ